MELETDEENSNWSYWAMEVWGKAVSKITDIAYTPLLPFQRSCSRLGLSLSLCHVLLVRNKGYARKYANGIGHEQMMSLVSEPTGKLVGLWTCLLG